MGVANLMTCTQAAKKSQMQQELFMEDKHESCILGAVRLRRVCFAVGICFLVTCLMLRGSYLDNGDIAEDGITGKVSPSSSSFRRLLGVALDESNAKAVIEKFDPNNSATYEDLECNGVHSVNKSQQCDFVKLVPACAGDDGLIPYFELVYCRLSTDLIPLAMIILVMWLLYLFLFLGTTAESFFCRELAYITKLLRLSPNVAGVTLLAIGNGAPDIFSVIAAFNHVDESKTSLAFGALFGAGMFVTNIVVGLVCIFRPFQLTKRPFLRDNIFYLFAVFWVFTLLWDNEMTLWHGIGMLFYYVIYVLVVVLGSLVYQYWKRIREGTQKEAVKSVEDTPVVYYDNKRMPDSLEASRHGNVIILPQQDDNSDDDETTRPSSTTKEHAADNPVIIVTRDSTHDSSSDSDDSRPMTPSERSAQKASRTVYSMSDTGGPSPRRRQMRESNETTDEIPRPRSKLEQMFDNAMYVAEDVIASSNPNLAKVWHSEYDREMVRQRQTDDAGSRVTTPFNAPKTPIIAEESFTSNVEEKETVMAASNATQPTETTPLLASPTPSDESPPVQTHSMQTPHPLRTLLDALFPFTSAKYRTSSLKSKIFQIIKYPLTLVLTLTIPVVDVNEPLNNWNKPLALIQCVVSPVFFSIGADEFGLILIGGVFPVIVIVLFCSGILSIIVGLTSSTNKPPIYHCVFAWAGFALSVLWIYLIANEIVDLLQVFGVVARLSDGILGITLLAWGNSIQDSVTNVTMARQGYPRMAVGACFGGPLLNILIGIGIATLIRSISKDTTSFTIDFTQVTMLAAFFLMMSLCISLLFMSLLQFKMRLPYGLFLFAFYICFVVVVVLAELEVFNIKIDGVLTNLD